MRIESCDKIHITYDIHVSMHDVLCWAWSGGVMEEHRDSVNDCAGE